MGGGGGVLVRGERTGPRVDVYGFGEGKYECDQSICTHISSNSSSMTQVFPSLESCPDLSSM
jgi:hypothetical protein